MIRLFTGYDPRESVGWHVFAQSVIENTSEPVAITTIGSKTNERDGSNAFTYARFAVPHMCNFKGFAIFADGADMLCLGDLAELWAMRDEKYAVQVVRHSYRTKYARKYVGVPGLESDNRDYPRKNDSSLIIFNNEHPSNRLLTPENIAIYPGEFLHRFGWLTEEEQGSLPAEWNVIIGEEEMPANPKLLHFSLGIPGFTHYAHCEGSGVWKDTLQRVMRGMG